MVYHENGLKRLISGLFLCRKLLKIAPLYKWIFLSAQFKKTTHDKFEKVNETHLYHDLWIFDGGNYSKFDF